MNHISEVIEDKLGRDEIGEARVPKWSYCVGSLCPLRSLVHVRLLEARWHYAHYDATEY